MDGSEQDARRAETQDGSTSERARAPYAVFAPEPGMRVSERVRLVRPLRTGGMAQVWVAEHLGLGIDVAVKFVRRGDDPTMRERMAREARVAACIDHPRAVRVFDHGVAGDGTPFLVMELIDGESLADRITRAGPLSIEETRRLVTQVAEVLAETHERGIVHRDIKPDNIMLLAGHAELEIKVVDFGIAKPVDAGEATQITDEGLLVGTPLFMAPEQLFDGRPADAQSDVWGLAIVTYEALVARRPFPGQTRAAIGLAIVMQRYERVTDLRPELPRGLDEVFDRALRIDAHERHPSAAAFAAAFDAASRGQSAPGPRPGRRRSSLLLPDALYGRDAELAALRAAFDEASRGSSRVVLVAGYSGIGKSSLVAHAQRTLVAESGVFASGKFDPFDRGTPYQSVVQALRELLRRTLRARATSTEPWRARMASALAESGDALLDVIPELEDVLGPSSAQREISPAEARNRLQHAVTSLATAMASPEHPLVLFLDDLQWADLASLDLIASLATDPESRHVLLIGAYRDNEVSEEHALTAAIERMRRHGALREIRLGPLDEDAVIDLVSDAFPKAAGRARLAAACLEKTHGNAFFLRRFLEVLHDEGLVRQETAERRWTFDLAAIERRAASEEVADFVSAEIERLPPRSREALRIAACIGDHFDVGVLAAALEIEQTVALELMRPALARQLVTPPAETIVATDRFPKQSRVEIWFAHDRIRQAARAGVSGEEAARVHRVAGLHLLDHLSAAEREQRLFEIVEHLDRGLASGAGASEAAVLRSLALEAARRALASAAFEAAHGYYRAARAHLAEDAWAVDYAETLALHVEGARAAYLAGDYACMERLVDAAVANGREVLDRVSAREVSAQALVSQQRLTDAVALAIELLRELGLEVPPTPSRGDVERAVGQALEALGARSADELASLPRVVDRRVAAIQRIQNGTMSSAYLAVPELLPILASSIVRSTLEHGVSPESPYGFAVFALVLTAVDRIDLAYATGQLALRMLERAGDRALRPKTEHVVAAHVSVFVDPLRDAIERDERVARLGVDTGDLEYAAWGLHCMVCNAFYAGVRLDALRAMFDRHRAMLEHQRQLAALGCTLAYGQAIANLTGAAGDPTRLVGPDYDEDRHREELERINFRGAAFIVSTVGTFVRYLFGDHEGALAAAERGRPFADGATATYHLVWWHQYRALAVLARVGAGTQQAEAALREIEADVERLKTWRRFSEPNHEHRVQLVEGEIARVRALPELALERFEASIAAASRHGFAHEEAIARELGARVLLERGEIERARASLHAAADAYDRWGASAKSAALRARI